MKLYNITENDVKLVIDQGRRETLPSGKIRITRDAVKKFKYPIRVIAIQEEKSLFVITAYPLKRGR